MASQIKRYELKIPRFVRVPRVVFPAYVPRVYATRLFFLLAYHAKMIDRVDIPMVELGKRIGVRDQSKLYSLKWWTDFANDVGSCWVLAPMLIIGDDLHIVPLVADFHVDLPSKMIHLTLNPIARDLLKDLSGGFTAVHYEELLSITHAKSSLAYVLFCSIENLYSQQMRTFTMPELIKMLELVGVDNEQRMKQIKKMIDVVQRHTALTIEHIKHKNGRSIEAIEFKVRRHVRIASRIPKK